MEKEQVCSRIQGDRAAGPERATSQLSPGERRNGGKVGVQISHILSSEVIEIISIKSVSFSTSKSGGLVRLWHRTQ